MKTDILTPKELFTKDVRYLIPTFQRPYIWNQEEQWEPLWDDIRNTAEFYLEELEKLGDDPTAAVRAENAITPHFLGAVVLQQQPTATSAIEERYVIDGQQRLTTLQLVLDAAQEVLEELPLPRQSRLLARLVLNDEDLTGADSDLRLKVWPTVIDREAFRHAMDNGLPVDEYTESSIVQGHEFFQLQVSQWLEHGPEEITVRADALVTTLMGLIQIVVIDLAYEDDANVIFETLNARGTPLIASDLIKNFVLHQARLDGVDPDNIYEKYLKSFDEDWWREETQQGRIIRPRVDLFLNYWLIMRTVDEVSAGRVFPAFREYVDGTADDIESVAEEMFSFGEAYRSLDKQDPTSVEGTFIYRWKVMGAGVVTPLLLWLFSVSPDQLPIEKLQRSLRTIESFLVRRMVCRMTTKDYNKLLLDLLEELHSSNDPSSADEVIVRFFGDQTAESRLWPDDRRLAEAFRTLPLYRLLTRGRLRIVLEGIEEALRTPLAETEHVQRGKLTIEHILPQSWHEHWPLAEGLSEAEAENASAERDSRLHSIGNLTLVNNKLNPTLSNGPWNKKQAGLQEHSVLFLNKTLLDDPPDVWDEAQIEHRSKELADLTATVWPDASSA